VSEDPAKLCLLRNSDFLWDNLLAGNRGTVWGRAETPGVADGDATSPGPPLRKAVFRAELFWLPCSMNWSGQPMRTTALNAKIVEFFKDCAAKAAHEHVIFQRENHIYIPAKNSRVCASKGLLKRALITAC